MRLKKRHLSFVVLGLVAVALAAVLVVSGTRGNMVFFYSPTDLVEKKIDDGRRIRVGGLVDQGSVKKVGDEVTFTVTDGLHSIDVVFRGLLPDLFREGQGVVAEGRLEGARTVDGRLESPTLFAADTVLARHDENYMPPEVADSLKKAGQWQHTTPEEGTEGGNLPDILRTGGQAAPPVVPEGEGAR